jgi:L-amino acid N-acyltransferase YncA
LPLITWGSPSTIKGFNTQSIKIPELNGRSNGKIMGKIKGTSWTHIGNYRKIIDNSIIIHFFCAGMKFAGNIIKLNGGYTGLF